MTKPSIDILLPYWGEFKLVKKTIDSIRAQTRTDWQLFILDDHYPSLEAREYVTSLKDNRITYIRHEKNIGITDNFNYAVAIAKAEYCTIIGCDDIMLPNYIETALENINTAAFYQPCVEVIDDNDKIYLPLGDKIKRYLQPNKPGLYSGEKLASSLCIGNWLYFPSIVWKTKLIQKYGFDNSFRIVQDVVLEMNLIKNGNSLFFDKTITFQYRRSVHSLSSREKSKDGIRFLEERAVYNRLSKDFLTLGWLKASLVAKVRPTSRLHKLLS